MNLRVSSWEGSPYIKMALVLLVTVSCQTDRSHTASSPQQDLEQDLAEADPQPNFVSHQSREALAPVACPNGELVVAQLKRGEGSAELRNMINNVYSQGIGFSSLGIKVRFEFCMDNETESIRLMRYVQRRELLDGRYDYLYNREPRFEPEAGVFEALGGDTESLNVGSAFDLFEGDYEFHLRGWPGQSLVTVAMAERFEISGMELYQTTTQGVMIGSLELGDPFTAPGFCGPLGDPEDSHLLRHYQREKRVGDFTFKIDACISYENLTAPGGAPITHFRSVVVTDHVTDQTSTFDSSELLTNHIEILATHHGFEDGLKISLPTASLAFRFRNADPNRFEVDRDGEVSHLPLDCENWRSCLLAE